MVPCGPLLIYIFMTEQYIIYCNEVLLLFAVTNGLRFAVFFSNSLINVDVINYPCIFWYKWDICFTQLKTERMAVLVQTIVSAWIQWFLGYMMLFQITWHLLTVVYAEEKARVHSLTTVRLRLVHNDLESLPQSFGCLISLKAVLFCWDFKMEALWKGPTVSLYKDTNMFRINSPYSYHW